MLSIRGTLNTSDLLTDLGADVAPLHGGWAHRGILEAARFVLQASSDAIRRGQELCLRNSGRCTLLVTGHSLGAGVACLASLLIKLEIKTIHPWFPEFSCVALAPPAVVSRSLAELLETDVLSVVHGHDMIPRTSAANVDRLIHDIVSASSRSRLISTVAPESGRNRMAKLNGLLVQEDDIEKQYPPGRLIMVAVDAQVAVCMTAEDFDGILLHSEMGADHLVGRYLRGLSNALTSARSRSASTAGE